AATPWPSAAEPAAEPEFAVVEESPAASAEADPAAAEAEIDLSSEWDDAITVETDTPEPEAAPVEVAAAPEEPADTSEADETIEEIRFYLSHSMNPQAMAALAKLQAISPQHPMIAALRTEVDDALQAAAELEAAQSEEPVVEEITVEDV